jgi:hypothetical protein
MLGCALKPTFVLVLLSACCVLPAANTSWTGVLHDTGGKPMAGAVVALHWFARAREYRATTAENGRFTLGELLPVIAGCRPYEH